MAKSSAKLESLMRQAYAATRQEHYGSALLMYRKALSLDKNDANIMFRLGHVLVMSGFYDEAIEVLKKAAKRRSHHLETLALLSQAQLSVGDLDGMHATLTKALSRDPSHGPSLIAKINAYLDSGLFDEARELLKTVEDVCDPHVLVVIARARFARETKDYATAVDLLEGVIADAEVGADYKRTSRFELGNAFDKMGEFDRAFECFVAANGAHNTGKTVHSESVQSAWSSEVLARIPNSTIYDERPVLIAGMPRSGTTLTERVISSHPRGASVGECPLLLQMVNRTMASNLDQDRIDSYAKEYLSLLDDRVGVDALRVVDKHMGTEKDLGLVSKVLPGVKVIHALRDPRDCCLSAYFQNFGSNVLFSRDLGLLGSQYVHHREMMDYWTQRLEIPVFTSVYEEFVSEQERHTRDLLDFIGIEFDEACLRFHESGGHVHTASSMQVRQPVYQSSKQRWKNYERHLGPLLDALGPYADGVMASSGVSDGSL